MIFGRLILIKLIWFLLQIAPLFSFNSCLILRSYCLRTPECTPFLDKFEKSCGYNTETCTGSSPSDCVHTLRQLRSFFPHDNCVCYDALGSRTECEWFRQAIFSNPCEKRLEDIGYERKLTNLEEYFDKRPVSPPHENEVLIDGRPVTESSLLRRSTRTPIADQIREWKEELSGELQTRNVIKKLTCNEALYDVCLKHISCKQLWRLFRQSCDVDAQNTCQMTDRETCWQSFEGLTWTGLGSCSCQTNNSDCHWIRLHTNYNKCIYEISRSGEFNALASYEPPGQSRVPISPPAPVPPPSAPIRGLPGPEARPDPRLDPRYRGEPYITVNPLLEIDDPDLDGPARKTTQVSRVLPTDKTTVRPTTRRLTTTTTTTKATITTTTPRTTTTAPQRILQDTRDRYSTPSTGEKWWITTTTTTPYPPQVDPITYQRQQYEEAMRRHKQQQQQQQSGRMPTSSSLPGAGPPSRMGGTKSYPTTPRPPYTGPTKRYPQFTPKTNTARSSCQDAQARCSADDSCAWHMAELSVRCQMETCRRDECATALRRFTTYVARPLAEPLMFCHCAENDEECFEQQALLYPKCLYSSPTLAKTCTEVVIDCSQDVRCFQLRTSIASVCEVSQGECIARSLDHCRQTLLHSRGSLLEAPCYCPMNDMECLKYQASMIPNNPCIEKAMVDYSRLMGYMDKKQNGREQSLRAQLTHSPSSGRNVSSSAAPYKFQGGTPSASRTSPGRGGGVYSGRTESSALDSSGTKDGRGRATQGSILVQSEESIETDAPPVINSGRNIKLEQPKSKTTVNPGSYESYETFLVTKPDDQLIETAILTGDEGRPREKEAGSRRVDYTKNQIEKGGSIGGNGRNGERDNRTQPKKSETEEKERRGDITVSEEEDAKKKRKEKMEEERRKQKEMREKQREEQRRKDAEMREKKRNEEKMKEKESKEARDMKEEMDKEKEKEKKEKEEKKNSMDEYVSRKNSKKVSSKISEKSDDKKADEDDIKATEKFPRPIQRQRQRTTTAPPTTTKAPELPPWATSTSTVEPSTTEYITIPPPLTEDGCRIKDANGKELFFHIGSLVRRNMDWAGRCSSWCECHDVDQLTCERLPCYEDIPCEAPLTQMEFGERLYLQGRGACMCESGVFVCDTPEEMPDLYPGLYILAGYSLADLELQKKELPSETLERAGFLSADVAKDIASRLQWALERRLPEDLKCRIVMLDELCEEGNAFYQVEWYGMNKNLNHTDEKWYADGAEKVCSPYVKKLVDSFTLNESPRFQLLLSIVKQLRMLDLLDALPSSASVYYNFPFAISILYILVRL